MFQLDQKLQADTFLIHDLKICRVLLMNDANYPWVILVPKKENLVELTDLDFEDQIEVLREINLVAKILKDDFGAHKINIATLGNVVRQLHIHVIARKKNDATFPKPVWGNAQAKPYEEKSAQEMIEKIKSSLSSTR